MSLTIQRTLFLFFIALSFVIAGCEKPAGNPGGFAVSVIAEPVQQEKIEDEISLVGSLIADEAVEIKNQIAGVIEEIGFEEGENVQKDQMLFMIDAQKLNAMLAQSEANMSLAKTTSDRLSSLIKAGAVSQQEFDQAKSDLEAKKAEVDLIHAQLRETVISAPFDGVTGERMVSLGQFVDQGTTLAHLISQDPIKAEFRVPERFSAQLKIGQPVKVSVVAYPDETFDGEVYFLDPQVDEKTRTCLVKARLPNPENKMRQGMFANLNLVVATREQALTIPETAIIAKGEEVYVFVVDDQGKAQMKPVTVGLRLAGKAEIVEGLSAGENVIVEGYQKIGPGSPVTVKSASEKEIPAAEK